MNEVTSLEVETLKKQLEASRRETAAFNMTCDKLLKELSRRQEEINQLKQTVEQLKYAPTVKMEFSAEEEIADVQLERLRQSSKTRALTLEETKQFDILVKNKRLSQDQSTINLNKTQYREISNEELQQIAAPVEE